MIPQQSHNPPKATKLTYIYKDMQKIRNLFSKVEDKMNTLKRKLIHFTHKTETINNLVTLNIETMQIFMHFANKENSIEKATVTLNIFYSA